MLLALLVGLTLTLVCQGHIHGNVRMGPHLTFLGELDHDQYGHNPVCTALRQMTAWVPAWQV